MFVKRSDGLALYVCNTIVLVYLDGRVRDYIPQQMTKGKRWRDRKEVAGGLQKLYGVWILPC